MWKEVPVYKTVTVDPGHWAWRKVTRYRTETYLKGYRTVYIDRGHWAYRTVTRYRTERYRSTVRYRVRKSYWYRRGWRWYRGTRTEWRTRSVWKTRRVPYRTRQRYWVKNMVPEQRLVGYDEIEHRDPVYGWREERRGTKTISVKKTVPKWMPVGTEEKWALERLPSPKPTPTPRPESTPIPASTPQPERPPTPEEKSTPYPSLISIASDADSEFELEGKWVARGIRLVRNTGKAITAGSVMFNALESGRMSISAPSLPLGSRREFLQGYGFNGTTYNPFTITKITGRQLVSGALSKASWITAGVTSLIGNVIDYGFGKNKDKGFGQEFAVSTGVDTVMTVGTGLAAAAIVAGGAALLGATLPLWGAIALTAGVGLAIGGILEAVGVGDFLKEEANRAIDAIEVGVQNLAGEVSNGVEAWKGIVDNANVIGSVVGERITEAAENAVNTVTNAVNNAIDTVDDAVKAAGNILGSIFGGGG